MLSIAVTAAISRIRAQLAGGIGLDFDSFGRKLFLREWMCRHGDRNAFAGFLNPVSCVRYFEFPFAAQALEDLSSNAHVLDVSSPRLFPLWLSDVRGSLVTMINPDARDIERTRQLSRYLGSTENLALGGSADATALEFEDNSFDSAVSISVIEHVGSDLGDDDSRMVQELFRVVRPGGRIVLTFPVKPQHDNEFRNNDPYELRDVEGGKYFFQRFYDESSIRSRILDVADVIERRRSYYVEKTPGWFDAYEKDWMANGLAVTVADPYLMCKNFEVSDEHPRDRTGVCGLELEVTKR